MEVWAKIYLVPPLPSPETPDEQVRPMYQSFLDFMFGPGKRLSTDHRSALQAIQKFEDYLDGRQLQEAVSLKIEILEGKADLAAMERFGEIALSLAQRLYPDDVRMQRAQEAIFWDRCNPGELHHFNAMKEAASPELRRIVVRRQRGIATEAELEIYRQTIIESN